MKKLLDETPDDLTRVLLEAGRAHRPPAANQAKLLVTLGVGAGVGLFSSKAFAWLGTSAGKLTVLGVGLGIAGAVYTALPSAALSSAALSSAALSSAALSSAAPGGRPAHAEAARVEARSSLVASAPSASPAAPEVPSAPAASAPSSPSIVPALVADALAHPRTDSVSSSRVANGVLARRVHAPAASESPRRVSRESKSTAARRDDVLEPLERLAEGPLPAAPAPPPAVGAPDTQARVAAVVADAPAPRLSGLETEIQLVDAMRGAAQRNDAPELRRLVDSYRGAFPEGQLRQEVTELALRALSKSAP